MEYFLLAIAASIIIALLLTYLKFSREKKEREIRKKNLKEVRCPICSSNLYVGENIYSKVYRPRDIPDQLCTISGCPHCFPKLENNVNRRCPVCHNNLSTDQALTARLFNKNMGKNHIHILGCPNCRKGKKLE